MRREAAMQDAEGMYSACSHLEVPADGAPALEAAFRERLGAVDGWPGFHSLEVLADRRRPGRYLMITRWATKDSFVAYMRSAEHDESHARIPVGPDRPRAAGFEEYRTVAT
jgi:heme oxygenase (mycobilin-producing)